MKLPRIFAYGRLRLHPMRRIPTIHAVDVCANDIRPVTTISRWYQLSWLGWTLNLDWPVRPRRDLKLAWQFPSMQTMDKIEAWLKRRRS